LRAVSPDTSSIRLESSAARHEEELMRLEAAKRCKARRGILRTG
jgi:hypothetical protein